MKTNLSKILFSLLILTVFSFKSAAGDGTVKEVQVNGKTMMICSYDNVKKKETLRLSDLVEDLKLIQFENKDEAFFKAWFISVSDNYIGIRQSSGYPYKLFDKSGKYLADIGSIGQGPGEYNIALYDDIIDEKNKQVYLAPFAHSPKILVYDLNGKYLRDIKLPFSLSKPKLHLSSDGSLSFVHMAFAKDKILAGLLNKEGKIIKEVAPWENIIVKNFDGEIFNTRNTTAFEFQHTSVDSLFHYDLKANTIYPVFTTTYKGENSFKQYIETKDYFITLAFGKNAKIATNKKMKTSSFVKIVNDFYGNMEVPISIVHIRNGYYVLCFEPGELISLIEERLKESSCTQKDKKVLKELLAKLDDNDNNVLFYGKLKK